MKVGVGVSMVLLGLALTGLTMRNGPMPEWRAWAGLGLVIGGCIVTGVEA